MDDGLSIINFILVRNTKFINIFGKIVGTKCPPLNRYLRHIIFLKCPPINRYLRHPSADDFWRENLSTLVSNFCLIWNLDPHWPRTMSSDSDEENVIFGLQLEPDPESISVYWEKNLKSHEYGVFYSHNMHYKWYRQKVTENSDRIRMDCSFKKSLGCKARAHVDVIHQEPLEDGTVPPPVLKLVLIHTPDSHNHAPDSCRFLAQSIMQKMKLEIQEFPCNKIKPVVDRVLLHELAPYENNKPLRDEILNSLPKNKVTTLSSFRKKITGGLPGILHQFILADIFYSFQLIMRVLTQEEFSPLFSMVRMLFVLILRWICPQDGGQFLWQSSFHLVTLVMTFQVLMSPFRMVMADLMIGYPSVS